MSSERKKWYETGERPDYRFSLANERTFLAWIRTSIAFIAGSLAFHLFGSSVGSPLLRTSLVLALLACGGIIGVSAYSRWRAVEQAMRNDEDLPRSTLVPLLGALVPLIAIGLAVLLLVD